MAERTQTGGRGALFVVAGPSGVGKSALTRRLAADDPGLRLSISHTTRPPRGEERDGVHYVFIEAAEFDRMAAAEEFLEWATVHGHRYGTARRSVEEARTGGVDVVLEIDVQGALQVKDREPEAQLVLLYPPRLADLETRMRDRGDTTGDALARRLRAAREELAQYARFDYLILNDDLETAVADLAAVVRGRRCRRERRAPDLIDRTLDE